MDKFSYINIREYLVQDNPGGIGEADLQAAISDFSCPRNLDVEHFLKENAIEFTKKNQSVTYLVLSNEDGEVVGYFTIALKPITINATSLYFRGIDKVYHKYQSREWTCQDRQRPGSLL